MFLGLWPLQPILLPFTSLTSHLSQLLKLSLLHEVSLTRREWLCPLILLVWIQKARGYCLLTFHPSYEFNHLHLPPQNVPGLIIIYWIYIHILTYGSIICALSCVGVHENIHTYTRETSIVGKHLGIWHRDYEIHYRVPSTTPSLSGHSMDLTIMAISCFWMQNVGRRDWSRCENFENFFYCRKNNGNISMFCSI